MLLLVKLYLIFPNPILPWNFVLQGATSEPRIKFYKKTTIYESFIVFNSQCIGNNPIVRKDL